MEYCDKKDMNKAKALDFAIRDAQQNYGSGYQTNRFYYNYLSNESWEKFKELMSPLHKAQYSDADGGELEEKNSPHGMLPPKMASFGSSSRLIYNLSKDITDFEFEKLLPTRVGGTANLDGYLHENHKDIFVEAKCREIYTNHTKQKINNKYKKVYEFIHNQHSTFDIECTTLQDDKEYSKFTFKYNNKSIKHFDIKQLICHFLAISANMLQRQGVNTDVRFIYLVFDPKNNTDFSHEILKKYERCILNDHENTIKEIKAFGDMVWLFDAIMKYQSEALGLNVSDYKFEFKIASQQDYL